MTEPTSVTTPIFSGAVVGVALELEQAATRAAVASSANAVRSFPVIWLSLDRTPRSLGDLLCPNSTTAEPPDDSIPVHIGRPTEDRRAQERLDSRGPLPAPRATRASRPSRRLSRTSRPGRAGTIELAAIEPGRCGDLPDGVRTPRSARHQASDFGPSIVHRRLPLDRRAASRPRRRPRPPRRRSTNSPRSRIAPAAAFDASSPSGPRTTSS